MKLRYKLLLFTLLLSLPALACGGDATPTSTPKVSTATSSSDEQGEVQDSVEQTQDPDTSQESANNDESDSGVSEPTEAPTDLPEPTEVPTDTPEPLQKANLGDLIEQEGYSFVAVTLEDPAPPGLIYSPTDGTKLVAVEVVIGNVSGEVITTNPLNATLLDTEGFAYQAELAGRDDQLVLVDLEPGERVKGWIAFEIPESSEADIIKYEVETFSSLVLQSGLRTVNGELIANSDVPLTVSGDVEREVTSKLGDLIEHEGYSLVAEVVENPTTPGMLYTPMEGRKLIAVQIVVGNESGEMITVNPLNATLVDTDGYVYEAETGGRDEQIELVDLAQGERVRGWVAFEIPDNSTPESIKYQVSGFPLIVIQAGLLE